MSVINTNYLSLVAQNNLQKSQSALGSAIERLSSGLRINSAKDDAAGQAISNRMTSQIQGLNQAQRNANDGISVAQTAEGALNQVNDNLQRVRELTVQAANSTNSQEDLDSIQAEISQRLTEINRISEQTDFNGTKVLSSDSTMRIQVGANDNEFIGINLKEITSTTLGLNTFSVSGDKAATLDDMVSEFGATGTKNFNVDVNGSSVTGVQVNVSSGKVFNSDGTTPLYTSQTTGKIVTSATNTAASTKAADIAAEFKVQFANSSEGDTKVIGGVTWKNTTSGGVDATADGTYSAKINGEEITVTAGGSGTTLAVTGSLYMDSTAFTAATTKFTNELNNDAATVVSLQGAGATYTGATITAGGNTYSVDAGGTVRDSGSKVMYIQNAGQASQVLVNEDKAQKPTGTPLEKLDAALKIVDTLRSDLGAIQNRFESAITNLQTNSTNLQSARSRIQDADYAVEVANMSKNQILQQAGTSVLAQANQIPQGVLSLLR